MSPGVLMDTGPVVAHFCSGEQHHHWAVETFKMLTTPVLTCEAVLTETFFLVARRGIAAATVVQYVEGGLFRIALSFDEEAAAIRALMERYANVPMSLADACLVRMAEMTGLPICTLDGDFAVYRAHGRRTLNLITPPGPRYMHEA
jgi:predicted nucleic acid-binding protein